MGVGTPPAGLQSQVFCPPGFLQGEYLEYGLRGRNFDITALDGLKKRLYLPFPMLHIGTVCHDMVLITMMGEGGITVGLLPYAGLGSLD